MRKVKILLLTPTLGAGGAEKVMRTIANSLDTRKFDICLAVLDGNTIAPNSLLPHVRVVDLKVKKVRNSILKIRRLVKAEKPDVVFSTLFYLNLYLAAFRWLFPRRMRFIARESSMISVRKHRMNPWVYKTLYKYFLKRFDRIVCQSQDMRDDLAQQFGLPEEKLQIINNPIDPGRTQKMIEDHSGNIPQFDIIAVGRLRVEKGYDRLLESFSHLKGKGYRLAIIGDGPQRELLETIIRNLELSEEVELLGFQENPLPFINNAKVFALSSHYEGFPNVVLEAGMCGKPTVSYWIPGGTREILEDGVNGFFAKTNEPADYADYLIKALSYNFDPEKIRTHVIQKFGVRKIMNQYERSILDITNF